jgi:hypothetical protein
MHRPRVISSRAHGVLDYTTSAAVAAIPQVLDFPKPAKQLCAALAVAYTGLSSVTDYPMSAKRIVPFKAHGAVELALAATLPVMPWALGFANHRAARTFCFGLAAMTVAVAAFTDWDDDD